jgi:peptidoglycan/xylan/chitin deacetylase (PgdA/CDA1 family)
VAAGPGANSGVAWRGIAARLPRSLRRIGLALLASVVLLGDPDGAAAQVAQAPVPILVYHRFHPTKGASTTIETPVFEAQLHWLAENGYHVVPLHALVAALAGTGPSIPGPAVVITADDGHPSVYTQMFPLIRRYRVPATLFIYPSIITERDEALSWRELEEMTDSGFVDVQSHTYSHPNLRHEARRRSPANFGAFLTRELNGSKASLEAHLGSTVDLLAWPYGVYTPGLERQAAGAGYVAAFAAIGGPARPGDDLFAIPRIMVTDRDRGARFERLVRAAMDGSGGR